MAIIAGIDGCKSGLICITKDVVTGSIASNLYPDAERLFMQAPKPELFAVDIPMKDLKFGLQLKWLKDKLDREQG